MVVGHTIYCGLPIFFCEFLPFNGGDKKQRSPLDHCHLCIMSGVAKIYSCVLNKRLQCHISTYNVESTAPTPPPPTTPTPSRFDLIPSMTLSAGGRRPPVA